MTRKGRFEFCRRHVAERFQQSTVIKPVDPLERREFHRLQMAPRSSSSNHLHVEEPESCHRLHPLNEWTLRQTRYDSLVRLS